MENEEVIDEDNGGILGTIAIMAVGGILLAFLSRKLFGVDLFGFMDKTVADAEYVPPPEKIPFTGKGK